MELIDKETAYKELSEYYHHNEFIQHLALSEALDRVPTVDAEPVVHGKWIYLDKENKFFRKHIVECSICNNSLDLYAVNGGRGDANYCPNCGAKMEKPE